jgi:hypothetical protein
MTVKNSTYKDCNISVDVIGPDARGAYSGSFVITHEVGDADDDRQSTPPGGPPYFRKRKLSPRLTRLAEDVIDGKRNGL